jgi:hypothetical protein
MSQDYFMGPDTNHPGRLINQRINIINEEIVKQRQYLPQFNGRNQQHAHTAGNTSQ